MTLQIARIMCGGILVSFFLWTAHIALHAPWVVARYVIALPEGVLSLSAINPSLDSLRIIDLVCLALLGAIVAITFALGQRHGRAFALLKAVQVGSMMMLLLGFTILAIDSSELWSLRHLDPARDGVRAVVHEWSGPGSVWYHVWDNDACDHKKTAPSSGEEFLTRPLGWRLIRAPRRLA